MTPRYSFVMPVLNEAGILQMALQRLDTLCGRAEASAELIVVDGGSSDDTLDQLASFSPQHLNVVTLQAARRGRAYQMNAGAQEASGEILVFLHADTCLSDKAFDGLQGFEQRRLWGHFYVRLNNPGLVYRIISWFINQRSRVSAIATGDQAIFIRKQIFEKIGGYARQPLMEDVELCSRLKALGRPYVVSVPVKTSARKWEREGIFRTIWLMWTLRARYALGANSEDLLKLYYPTQD